MVTHPHHKWLADLNRSVVESYEDDAEMAREPGRVQQVGHRVESKWLNVLTQWLPRGYQVATRKYILLESAVDGKTVTRETDIVVLHPAYPESLLRERE